MKRHRTLLGRAQVTPAVTAVVLGTVLACGSEGGGDEPTQDDNPFAAQTYDELMLGPAPTEEVQVDGGAAGGGPVGSGGGSSTGGGSSSTGGTSPGSGGVVGTGGGVIGGSAGKGGGPGELSGPSAFWKFDDCSAVTRALLDSSGNGIHAIRTVTANCAEGISGQSVFFDEAGDRVEALNAPQFALDRQLAVAAWVNPEITDGNRPIVLKRLEGTTAFSLRVQNGQAQFSVELDTGRTVTARAPIEAGEWSHVAGLFDGRFVRLFINGEQVGQVFGEGSIRDVDVVMRVGGTTQTQRFAGRIDEVFVSTNPITPEQLAALACVRKASTVEVSPLSSGPNPPGTQVQYSVSALNNDSPTCGPRDYFMDASRPEEFDVFVDPFFAFGVPPGGRADFSLFATATDDAEPGPTSIPFTVFSQAFDDFENLFGEVEYIVAEQTGCFSRTFREIFIRDVNIVDDPLRTTFDGPPGDSRNSAWTFKSLIENASPTPDDAPDLVEAVFSSLAAEQVVNSFSIEPRPFANEVLLDAWPRAGDGRLDLTRAPLRLLGIVNRIDLRNLDEGHAGEGRFVFGVLGRFGEPLEFTVILEYQLAATSEAEVIDWARAWHSLSEHPFPSEQYNAALQTITDSFTGRGVAPDRPNGTALLRLRTNEIALDFQWQLREFEFGTDGFLKPSTVKLTPDGSFNFTDALGRYINENAPAIVAERHDVPLSFEGSPFLGGAIFNNIDVWFANGVMDNEARHKFSLNTCNGCHGGETNTGFLHVFPREQGQQSFLSGFMTGIQVSDPVTGELRFLDDLQRRNDDLESLVCLPVAGLRMNSAPASVVNVRKGIGRVH